MPINRSLVALAELAACGAVVAPAAFAAQPVETNLSVNLPFGSLGGETTVQKVISAFEALHPNIHVTLTNGAAPKTMSQIAAGEPPDVGTVDYGEAPSFYRKGMALDLTPFIERDHFDTSILPPNDESLKYHGDWYGLPQAGGAFADRAIFYDRDMFRTAGIPYPTPAWTWDQFADIAKKLTQDRNGDGKNDQVGYTFSGLEWPIYVWSGGGNIFTQQGDTYKFALNQDAAVKALDWWSALTKQGVAVTAPPIKFQTGKVAMATGAYFQANTFQDQKLGFDWSISTFPNGPAGSVNRRITHPFVIPAGAKHPEAAWTFLKYWLSQPAQHELTIEWKVRPPQIRPIAQELARVKLNKPPYSYAAFMGVTGTSRALPIVVPGWDQISPLLDKAMIPIWEGKISPQSAMDSIAAKVNGLVQSASAAG